jgi:hypothetical protein
MVQDRKKFTYNGSFGEQVIGKRKDVSFGEDLSLNTTVIKDTASSG